MAGGYNFCSRDPSFIAAILDVVMPHISGPELVRFMKTETPDAHFGNDDDGGTGPKTIVGQLCSRRRCFRQSLLPRPAANMLQMLIGKGGE